MKRTEEAIRSYDGKTMVWEKKKMVHFVQNYSRIKNKEYCNPYFWILIDVKDENKNKKGNENEK